jgi:hypothetical protein
MKNAARAKRREPIASEPRVPLAFGEAESQTTITDWLDRWLQRAGHTPRSSGFLVPTDTLPHDLSRAANRGLASPPPMPRGMAFLVYSPDVAPAPVPVATAELHMWSLFSLLPKNQHTWKIALHAAAYLRRLPKLNACELPPHQAACDFITALRLAADYVGAVTDPGQDAFWIDALRRALALSLTGQGLALGEGFEMVDADFLNILEANMLNDLQWHLGLGAADESAAQEAFFAQVDTAPVLHEAKALTTLDDAQAQAGVGLRALLQQVTPLI